MLPGVNLDHLKAQKPFDADEVCGIMTSEGKMFAIGALAINRK